MNKHLQAWSDWHHRFPLGSIGACLDALGIVSRSLRGRPGLGQAVAGLCLALTGELLATQPSLAWPSYNYLVKCGAIGSLTAPCFPPLKTTRIARAIVDWYDPVGRVAGFNLSVDYDPAMMTFNRDQTTLLCDLRSSGVAPYCPPTSPGQGTRAIDGLVDEGPIDQTGLTIHESTNASGLPSVTFEYKRAAPVASAGERNFLALAFDLVAPLPAGSTVTYSPTLLADASLATTSFSCTDTIDRKSTRLNSSHSSVSRMPSSA